MILYSLDGAVGASWARDPEVWGSNLGGAKDHELGKTEALVFGQCSHSD